MTKTHNVWIAGDVLDLTEIQILVKLKKLENIHDTRLFIQDELTGEHTYSKWFVKQIDELEEMHNSLNQANREERTILNIQENRISDNPEII